MPRLKKYQLKESDLATREIQAFNCGDERWEREVSSWIKSSSGPNSVVEDMRQFGIAVWLYRTDPDGEKRGFVNAKTPRADKQTGVVYERMFMIISDLADPPAPQPT